MSGYDTFNKHLKKISNDINKPQSNYDVYKLVNNSLFSNNKNFKK